MKRRGTMLDKKSTILTDSFGLRGYVEAYRHCLTHYRQLLLCVLLDFTTFILLGASYSYFFLRIFPHLEQLIGLTPSVIPDMEDSTSVSHALSQVTLFYEHYYAVLWQLLYFFLSVFVIWTVFQCVSWYITSRTFSPVSFGRYVRPFLIVTFSWFVVFLLLEYFALKLLLLMSTTVAPFVLGGILFVIVYFLIMSYVSLRSSYHVWFSFTHFRVYLVVFFGISLLVGGVVYVGKLVSFSNHAAFFILPLVVFVFPFFTYGRVCLLMVSRHGVGISKKSTRRVRKLTATKQAGVK